MILLEIERRLKLIVKNTQYKNPKEFLNGMAAAVVGMNKVTFLLDLHRYGIGMYCI